MISLNGKVAIITGSRRGLGRADALLLAKVGARVVIVDLVQKDCDIVAEEIKKGGGEALAIKCDVSKKSEVEKMVKKTIERFGKIDILVNNVAIGNAKPLLEISEKEWEGILNNNLKGYFLPTQICSKEMIKQKSGVIVNIASTTAERAFVNHADYAVSKAGIVSLTKTSAKELAPYNIRVNAILPGLIPTPLTEHMVEYQEILKKIPMGRDGRPEEVANAVLFLASEESSYITGVSLPVDGGILLN